MAKTSDALKIIDSLTGDDSEMENLTGGFARRVWCSGFFMPKHIQYALSLEVDEKLGQYDPSEFLRQRVLQ
jgi:hypothetical protein